jgi:hypothetical protein
MKKIMFFLPLVVLFSLQTAAQSYELKYGFKEGQTYMFREETNNEITQSMMGNEMKITNISRNLIKVTALKNTSEGTHLNVSLDSAYISVSMPMKDTAYYAEELMNKRIGILLSPQGKVLSREMIDTMDLNEQLIQLGNKEAMQFIKFSPDRKVGIGESWIINHVDTMNMLGGNTLMTSEMEYTVAGIEEKGGYSVLKIPFKGKIKIEGKGEMMGFEFFLEGMGDTSGDLYFAHKEGLPVQHDLLQSFDITMAATGNQNMIIPITQEAKTTRVLVK